MISPADERKAETRRMIMAAARRVFSEKGFHKAQIADIVREAGVSTGSVYAHFKDKRNLYEQIIRENLESLRVTLKELSQTNTPADARERVSRWRPAFTAFFDYVEEHPDQILLVLRGGIGMADENEDLTWEFMDAFSADIAEDFRKWEDLGFIAGANATLMGHIITGMCLHVALSYLKSRQFSRAEAIETLMQVTSAMVYSFLTRRGRSELADMIGPVAPAGDS
ncbi:MAG TPA: TetR/AcrR family transcriptional regulator [Deltaproteobacteria bacterium]|nr:TetR/AcrR family transcriptional regulator [Deltaproteobacteria bacterium]